ncbi:MAG: endopeptidase La [Candidatus Sumerlaeaceae bacterium]
MSDTAADILSPMNRSDEDTDGTEIPDVLSILPLEHFILYPSMIAPIIVGDDKSKRLVDDALGGQRMVGVLTKRPDSQNLTEFSSLFTVGTAATILKMLKMPDGTIRLLLHGVQRVRILEPLSDEPYLRARVAALPDVQAKQTSEMDALVKSLHGLLGKAIELSSLPEDLRVAAVNLNDAGKLADLVASNLSLKVEEQQQVLETAEVKERLKKVHYILSREIEVLEIGSKIQNRVKNELDKNQREYLLREQLKAIRKELGEEEGGAGELDELKERIDKKALPDHVREVANKELNRLRNMQPASAEYTVSRTYLDIILDLPWMDSTKDTINVPKARRILDRDHYDLEKVKDRILEYLSVRKLKKDMKGPILCFVGPPGVGKTSLGRSIGEAMGRKFVRISLGGMRDEAEIRGHRRTYIGAMPGRIVKSLRQVGACNPVILLDEIDKLGSDYRGDPSSALLEVLDPEQNYTFSDHYLDMPFDLSKVMFITTANQLDPIPGPLRDRMEIIEVNGYTLREKLQIAKKYTIPKQMAENGLTPKNIMFTDASITRLIEDYTREAGLRNLERQIGNVCRKVARRIVEGKTQKVQVKPSMLSGLIGPPKYRGEVAERAGSPGVAVGMAWTPVGGEILFIEATVTAGTGKFVLTGQLGDVMRESAQAALTYVHTVAEQLHIPEELFFKRDIHVHVPAGAIPKDGPSAGTAICTAIASLLTGRAIRDYLAMTGEITLKGNVLAVGGIKEKVLAAARAGIREIILPERNRDDADQLPDEIKKKVKFHFATRMEQVLKFALQPEIHARASRMLQPLDVIEAEERARIASQEVEAAGPAQRPTSQRRNGPRNQQNT